MWSHVKARIKEPSTWAGAGVALLAVRQLIWPDTPHCLTVHANSETAEAVAAVVAAVGGLAGVVLKDQHKV